MKKNDTDEKIKRRKPSIKRKEIIKSIRFTKEEWKKIQKEMKKANINFPDFARASILKKKNKSKSKNKTRSNF